MGNAADDALELYRMIRAVCDVIDVLLTTPEIDRYLMGDYVTPAGMDILNEYATMRRFMLAGSSNTEGE